MVYLPEDLFDFAQTEHSVLFEGCAFPWDVLKKLSGYIQAELKPALHHTSVGESYIGKDVFIGEGTIVEAGAMILGPTIIGKNCEIRHNAYIRGGVIVGDNCVVGNSSELKHCWLFNGCKVPHFNYVGDSVLGHEAHLGAGVVLSNYKLWGDNIWVDVDGQPKDTGLNKFGALIGDHVDIGCNTVVNPGSIIGRNSVLYPNVLWRELLPANLIVKNKSPLPQDITTRRPRNF